MFSSLNDKEMVNCKLFTKQFVDLCMKGTKEKKQFGSNYLAFMFITLYCLSDGIVLKFTCLQD